MRNQPRQVRVRVIYRKDRKKYSLRWTDPATGKAKEETTEAKNRRAAWTLANTKSDELTAKAAKPGAAWSTFRKRVETEKFGLQSKAHQSQWRTAANSFEAATDGEHGELTMLCDANGSRVSLWLGQLAEKGRAKATIASYLNTLMAGLRWAETVWPDYHAPTVKRVRLPKRKLMRGRPLTGEEFDRMLKSAGNVVGKKYARSWQFFLRGLYLGGLRLSESLQLTWDQPDRMHVFNLDSRRPMLKIWSETEKGREDRMYPIPPDFAELLRSVPQEKRRGRVFRPRIGEKKSVRRMDTASKIIARIGRRAKVVVDRKAGAPRYATAHDLRRSFGDRWAPKLKPIRLMQLMRHKSIETTLKYYVKEDADAASAEIWAAFGDKGGDTSADASKEASGQSS